MVAGALAALALLRWIGAVADVAPVLFGEGAVAHAGQLVARGLDPYAPEPAGRFVAANYPPLAFVVAALGEAAGPFVALRVASVVATLALAVLVGVRSRSALAGVALGAAFLALFPVQVWGPAHKPDPLAVALTAGAIVAAGRDPRRAALSGGLGALALWAKPTAALPLGAVLLYLLWRERVAFFRVALALAAALAILLVASVARFDAAGLWTHVVTRNALPFVAENALLLLVVAAITFGAFAVLGVAVADGRTRAYLAGAFAVALLGGREGATVNYLLDLCAAASLALAARADPTRSALPVLLLAQLAVAQLVGAAGLFSTTGAWADPSRVALAAGLARTTPQLAEDSGILVANGIDPDVDDLFLWSRLVAQGTLPDEVTPRVRAGEFETVLSDVDLSRLDDAPTFERLRWSPALARAVLGAYRLDVAAPGRYRYVRRTGLARD